MTTAKAAEAEQQPPRKWYSALFVGVCIYADVLCRAFLTMLSFCMTLATLVNLRMRPSTLSLVCCVVMLISEHAMNTALRVIPLTCSDRLLSEGLRYLLSISEAVLLCFMIAYARDAFPVTCIAVGCLSAISFIPVVIYVSHKRGTLDKYAKLLYTTQTKDDMAISDVSPVGAV